MTSEMYRNSTDADDKEYYGDKLSSLYSQIEIANTLDLLNKGGGSERTFEGGVEVGGGEVEEEVETSRLTKEQVAEIDENRRKSGLSTTQKQNEFLKANPPDGVDAEDWSWWVDNRGKSLSAHAGAERLSNIDTKFTSYAEAMLEKWTGE